MVGRGDKEGLRGGGDMARSIDECEDDLDHDHADHADHADGVDRVDALCLRIALCMGRMVRSIV